MFATWTIGELAIGAVILLALVALVCVAAAAMKVPIPEWVTRVIGIVVVAVVVILAIRFLLTLM